MPAWIVEKREIEGCSKMRLHGYCGRQCNNGLADRRLPVGLGPERLGDGDTVAGRIDDLGVAASSYFMSSSCLEVLHAASRSMPERKAHGYPPAGQFF